MLAVGAGEDDGASMGLGGGGDASLLLAAVAQQAARQGALEAAERRIRQLEHEIADLEAEVKMGGGWGMGEGGGGLA